MSKLPTIGVMLGDVTGIGPEIAAKVLAAGAAKDKANLVVFGDARVLDIGIRDAGVALPYTRRASMDEVRFPRDDLPVVDLGNVDPARFTRGEASAESGKLTGDTLKTSTGPISSDAIFLKALRGEFDGVVMMYHDQGQIATKLLGFNKGVTVTAGLKVVFTTPAHGTAYDIVGRGKADPGAMEAALTLSAQLAAGRIAARTKPRAHAA